MKIALVYDRINKWGGAESVLLALHEIFPDAPLYTSVYDKKLTPWADVFDVHTSFLQKSPLPKNKHEYYPFLMGIAFETFNFDKFDVVISVTHEFAKAVITKPHVMHICYCLTPVSYLWSGYEDYFSGKSNLFKKITSPLIKYLRWYDKIIAHRPDKYLAISKTVQGRIKKYYGQECDTIYPPVNLYKPSNFKFQISNFYLIVSRLVPNKRIDIVVQAFNNLKLPLKIVGTGTDEQRLKNMASNNIQFLGHLTDEQLRRVYMDCKALIVPGVEDFGIVSVEAQSNGKPVIAYKEGGSIETIVEGKTGYLFDRQTPSSLVKTINELNLNKIDPADCIANAQKYAKSRFKREFRHFVEESFKSYNNTTYAL